MALKRLLTAEAERRPVVHRRREPRAVRQRHDQLPAVPRRGHARSAASRSSAPRRRRCTSATPAFGDGEVAPTKIELGALTPAESEQLLRELCKQLPDVPPRLVAHVRTLGGSPRAIHELVRLLLESDVIVARGHDVARSTPSKLATMHAAEDVRGARRRAHARDGRDRAPRARDGRGRRRDVVARRDHRARARRPARSRIPTARRSRRSRRAAITRALAVVAAIGKLVEREWLVEVPQSSVVGRARAALRVPEPVVDRLQGHRRGARAATTTRSSRAGSSCIPRAAARRRRKKSAVTSRSPVEPREAATALSPRGRGRARAVRERARDPAVRSRPRLHRRSRSSRRASTCGTTSARSTS